MELPLEGLPPAPPAKKGRQSHVGSDGDPNEVYIRSFPDPRAARMVRQICWGRTTFTAESIAALTNISIGLATQLCERAVEWKWAHRANAERRDEVQRLYVGQI